jgi:hypothetical protein
MQLTRQHVVDLLRRTGFAEAAQDASRTLPDPVELDDVLLFLVPYGITRDDLISERGAARDVKSRDEEGNALTQADLLVSIRLHTRRYE